MINPNKTTSVRELGSVSIENLRKAVLEIPDEIWVKENSQKPNKFGVFHSTEHIIFRFINDFKSHKAYHDFPIWQHWQPLVAPIIEEATQTYGYPKGESPRIMLAKLLAKGQIGRHIDGAPAAQFPHKIHVPLITNAKATFEVNHKAYHLEEGKAYEVNNIARHSAKNDGPTDRIHLIFEYFPSD